jgi:hypothetical protein
MIAAYSSRRRRSQNETRENLLQNAKTGPVDSVPGKREKRIHTISPSGISNWSSLVYCGGAPSVRAGGEKAERVEDCLSWAVGAERTSGIGDDKEEKPVMDQRTILSSRSDLDKIRSL